MARIPDFDWATLHGFIRSSVEPGTTVRTDGLDSYREIEGYVHNRKVQRRLKHGEHMLPRVHRAVDARNTPRSRPAPAPPGLPQRIRLPLQPAQVGVARKALLPDRTAGRPDRSDYLRETGPATRSCAWLSQVNSPKLTRPTPLIRSRMERPCRRRFRQFSDCPKRRRRHSHSFLALVAKSSTMYVSFSRILTGSIRSLM